jgi:hypothetical protein
MIRNVKTFSFKDDRRRAENLPDLLVSIRAGYTTWIVAKRNMFLEFGAAYFANIIINWHD